jgi:two-component system, response regulator RegA
MSMDSPRRSCKQTIGFIVAIDHLDVRNASIESLAMRRGVPFQSVVIIDDDQLVLRSYERAFVRLGMRTWTAATSALALELVERNLPDLAVIDLRLGTDSGLDLIEPVRRYHPPCSIAVVSAYLSVASTASALRKGVDVVLFKPVLAEEILGRISSLDDPTSTYETPTLARAEWEHISRVLTDCNGNVSLAARKLGLLRQSLQRKLRKHAPFL